MSRPGVSRTVTGSHARPRTFLNTPLERRRPRRLGLRRMPGRLRRPYLLSSRPSPLCTDDETLLLANANSLAERLFGFLGGTSKLQDLAEAVEDERLEKEKVRRICDGNRLK